MIVKLCYNPYFNYNVDNGYDNQFDDSCIIDDYSFWNEVNQQLAAIDEDLTEYLPDDLADAVTSVRLRWNDEDDRLEAICNINGSFEAVKDALVDWVNGQMSDGWGEGFEQQELASTEVYYVFNEANESDVEFFGSERAARRDADDKNAEIEAYGEDEEDFESEDHYEFDSTTVTIYCSFWKHNVNIPAKIITDANESRKRPNRVVRESRKLLRRRNRA